MKFIEHETAAIEQFPGGATYRTLVGDDEGSTPVRTGIQVSPPGYQTPEHSHPYVEVITVLEGTGEAWAEGEEGTVPLHPGVTLILPPGQRHGFRVTGDVPLRTLGVHASPHRIVNIDDV